MDPLELFDIEDGAAEGGHGDSFNSDSLLAAVVLRLRDRFQIRLAIETGTYHGVTTEWLARHFDTVHSIEVNPAYLAQAAERLRGLANVTLHEGSSADLLGQLLSPDRTLVFLDAHWNQNPLRGELAAIAHSTEPRPLVMIHDFCVPDRPEFGFDTYPDQGIVYNWDHVADAVQAAYGDGYRMFYNRSAVGARRGCCFVVPEAWFSDAAEAQP